MRGAVEGEQLDRVGNWKLLAEGEGCPRGAEGSRSVQKGKAWENKIPSQMILRSKRQYRDLPAVPGPVLGARIQLKAAGTLSLSPWHLQSRRRHTETNP